MDVTFPVVLAAQQPSELQAAENMASILDLHSGALSMGKQFVNIYRWAAGLCSDVFLISIIFIFYVFRNVRGRIQAAIAEAFGLDPTLMYLTKPTFFSRINSTAARTQHDEYWHPHIDKVGLYPKGIHDDRSNRYGVVQQLKCDSRETLLSPFIVAATRWFNESELRL
uniref:Uncharacterized protein n=1 Tax=Oryzias sinensis TaxID=183150 RepID=A0A8C8DMR2_9TELE